MKTHGLHDRRVVRERLAHAHEDHVRHARPGIQRVGNEELTDDLGGLEIPIEAHRAGEAEGAAESAAHLGRQAERQAILVGHQHRAHAPAVTQVEHQLPAAVQRRRDALDLRYSHLGALHECPAELLRKIGHRGEVEDPFPIDPRRELAAAIARRPELDGEVFHFRGEQSDKIDEGHRLEEYHARLADHGRALSAT